MKIKNIGLHILRLSLSFVFLWFGFSQLSDVTTWTAYVPAFATAFTDAGTLVLLNGTFEIFAGIFLAFGLFVRPLSIILGIHLLVISLSIGLTAVGVRDIGLALATISLGFMFSKENREFFVQNENI